jgi:Malectin domain
VPTDITANGAPLGRRRDLTANGYTLRALANGDAIVSVRHDGATEISVRGLDPQIEVNAAQSKFEGNWNDVAHPDDHAGSVRVASAAGSALVYTFTGNQVRLVGCVTERGGLADVYVDDVKQLAPIDFYGSTSFHRQILYYRNGLADGPHTLKIVARGAHDPLSKGDEVYAAAIQFSDATGSSGFGEGGGPTDTQRLIFGYTGRVDYVDSQGNSWRPGTEFVARTGSGTDVVAKTWWTMRQAIFVREREGETSTVQSSPNASESEPKLSRDQELYRYGVHWKDFTVNLTEGPGIYHVRLKFAEHQYSEPRQRAMTIYINDQKMADGFDVFATAGVANRAVDVVYNQVQPQNGVIAIRFVGESIEGRPTEAMVQAIEVGPGDGGSGSHPKSIYCPQCK